MNIKNLFTKLASRITNRNMVEVPRETLAKIVSPLMATKGDEFSDSNKALIENYNDLSDWVRIGFHQDTDKGTMYDALQDALQHIVACVNKSDDANPTILIERKKLDNLRGSACQISGAALNLEFSAKKQNKYQILPDRHGTPLMVPLIQIYNRPNESHQMAAYKLREIAGHFDSYFKGEPIKTAMLTLLP